jgi:hypothetical protein
VWTALRFMPEIKRGVPEQFPYYKAFRISGIKSNVNKN